MKRETNHEESAKTGETGKRSVEYEIDRDAGVMHVFERIPEPSTESLHEFVKKRELSRSLVAEITGVSTDTVAKWMRGLKPIPVAAWRLLHLVFEKRYGAESAAEALGLSPETIRKYCVRYEIGMRDGRDWILTDSDLDTIRDRKGKRGRPAVE